MFVTLVAIINLYFHFNAKNDFHKSEMKKIRKFPSHKKVLDIRKGS